MARVLIVDDAVFIRKVVGDVLRGHGHEVVGEAGNGIEALEKYKELKPDVITLDITMPERDGLSALKDILAFDPSAKVLMCSALKERAKIMEALHEGACDYILKPIAHDRVLQAIERAVAA